MQPSDRYRRNISEPDAQLALMLLVFVVLGVCLYLVVARFHVRGAQLLEAALYFLVIAAAVVAPLVRRFTTNDSRKKRAPFVVQTDKDEREVEAAWKQNAVLLGYNMDEKPWIWPDEVRVMQGIVLGMTGSGKTTLLKNIIAQDLARFTGPPEDRHRIPMVIFDGKGDLEFFEELLPYIHRAGRLHQLRLLNPSRADLSVLYNPFFTRDDDYAAQVNMIFGSFNLHDEFFAKHQLSYLGDVVRVLYYTGTRYNFYDVIVMLLDEQILQEQIGKATHRLDRDAVVTAQQRLNFEMSVKNLLKSMEDRDRVAKIQGLINECMTFLDDDLSALTGHYDDLLSMDDVIDQELILFVSLNVNKNTEPVRSLGKMLLQNIQLTVGKRYEDQADRRRQNRPIFSIVLDEFAPFGYRNFAQILQTARGTNTAFLFSMQSVPQLMQVGRGFKEEVTSAPNTTMTLRTRDEETAKYFINASAEQIMTRRSVQKERGLFGWGRYEETGRATESEDRETRSQDESIKNLPKGRMEILMPAASGVDERCDVRLSENYFRCAGEDWVPKTIDDRDFPCLVYIAGEKFGWTLREICIARCLFESGARISEVTGLNVLDWARHDFGNHFSASNKGSYGIRVKTLVVSSTTVKLLRRYFDDNVAGRRKADARSLRISDLSAIKRTSPEELNGLPLFLNKRGRRMSATLFRDFYWKPALEAAGIDADPHQARHWFVTNALRNIDKTSTIPAERIRRRQELIQYMAWRSGERTLSAYDHVQRAVDFEVRLDGIHREMRRREMQISRGSPPDARINLVSQVRHEEAHLSPDLAFLLGEDHDSE